MNDKTKSNVLVNHVGHSDLLLSSPMLKSRLKVCDECDKHIFKKMKQKKEGRANLTHFVANSCFLQVLSNSKAMKGLCQYVKLKSHCGTWSLSVMQTSQLREV